AFVSLLCSLAPHVLHSFPTRRSSDLVIFNGSDARRPTATAEVRLRFSGVIKSLTGPAFSNGNGGKAHANGNGSADGNGHANGNRSEEHTSELQSRVDLVCRLLLEKKK